MPILPNPYRPYAARGAVLLDERRPDWARGIDLSGFDVGDQCLCVLGQLYGDDAGRPNEDGYCVGLDEIFGGDEDAAAVNGFNVPDDLYAKAVRGLDGPNRSHASHVQYVLLQAAWIEEILARRTPETPTKEIT